MKINCFSITFWFNIFENHQSLLSDLDNTLKGEYQNFNVLNGDNNNLLVPIVTGINKEKMTNFSFSKINMQYNMDKVTMDNFNEFKEKALNLFEFFEKNEIEVMHTAIFINGEIVDDEAIDTITKNTINKKIKNEDLIDITLKLGKKHEDLFYKIITVLNKRQIKLPQKIDEQGRLVPIPLISWNGALVETEIIEVSYEINDKYSFDFTKNYHTTEFFLNKMLYILEQDLENDINNLIENGEF